MSENYNPLRTKPDVVSQEDRKVHLKKEISTLLNKGKELPAEMVLEYNYYCVISPGKNL